MRARPRGLGWVVVAAALGTAACTEPMLQEPAPADADAEPIPDPGTVAEADEALIEALAQMTASVEEARAQLLDAAAADDLAAGRAAGGRALARLLDEGGAAGALLPATETDRTTSGTSRDALTRTLTAARDAGTALGRTTVEVLRDPVAGDLGAWQRDPAGMVAAVESELETPRDGADLDALEGAVLSLPGDATRALAWTLLVTRTDDLATLRGAAERGAAHLTVVLLALEQLRTEAGVGQGADG
jgi:hypothetical protein